MLNFRIITLGILCCSFFLLHACSTENDGRLNTKKILSAADRLSADSTGGFARAHRSRKFTFPQDHLAHPDFKHEWWYFTGNIVASSGERFGYQFTVFRIGLIPNASLKKPSKFISSDSGSSQHLDSKWRANHFYMGHLALTDVNNKQHYSYEKFARNAHGLAGAQLIKTKDTEKTESAGIKVWVEDWQIESQGDGVFPLRLQAQYENISLDLTLDNDKAPVFHGYDGLSQKGKKAGNASYYYSITRLKTHGHIKVDGSEFRVKGHSWLDREWSTSALEKGQVGWDWFALQLKDGVDIMFYNLRRDDGSLDPYSSGTIISKDGKSQLLLAEDVNIEVLNQWESNQSNSVYPASWNIRIPKHKLELNVEPLIPNQENNLTVRYWEGAVSVSGTKHLPTGKKPIDGYGYVELAGY